MTKKLVKLNKVAKAWVAALRSGKYKQTKDVLTRVNYKTGEIVGHCCLGVLCELAVEAKVISPATLMDGSSNLRYDRKSSLLPASVMRWSGMKSNDGTFGEMGADLTSLNDGGKSFKQIARIIEQKAAELFV